MLTTHKTSKLKTAAGILGLLSALPLFADNPALNFVAVTPCRVVDTRQANAALGSPDLMPGTRDFPLLSGACNIPNAAAAYSLNVTAVPKTTLGYLTVYATGQDKPATSRMPGAGTPPPITSPFRPEPAAAFASLPRTKPTS